MEGQVAGGLHMMVPSTQESRRAAALCPWELKHDICEQRDSACASAPEEGARVTNCGSCDLSAPPAPFLLSDSCSRVALV